MVTTEIRTKLVKSASEDVRRSVLLMEAVQVKVDTQVIQKPRWSGRSGTLQDVFLLKANHMQIRLDSNAQRRDLVWFMIKGRLEFTTKH